MGPADGLVTGKKDVTVLPANNVLFTREEIERLTCEETNSSLKPNKNKPNVTLQRCSSDSISTTGQSAQQLNVLFENDLKLSVFNDSGVKEAI